jgi:hypothetical protein
MLRVLDAGTGAYVAVRPARPGLLRVRAEVPPARDAPDLTAVRVLLVADLLFRIAELGQTQALISWAFPGHSAEQIAAAERAASTLNIHPPAMFGDPADVHVTADVASQPDSRGGTKVRVAAAHGRNGLLPGHDPLATRLALMSYPYHQPADLTDDVLADARETLGRWRRQAAIWAESPSRPVAEHAAAAFRAASGDLDTGAVLTLLRGLASDGDAPAGARFETFMFADRLLGLDLAREIGTVRQR